MTLQWTTHDSGEITAIGDELIYIIRDADGGQSGMVRMWVNKRIAYFTSLEEAKEFAEGMDG